MANSNIKYDLLTEALDFCQKLVDNNASDAAIYAAVTLFHTLYTEYSESKRFGFNYSNYANLAKDLISERNQKHNRG